MDKEIVTAGDGDPALQKHMFPSRQHLRRLGNVFSKNPLYFITCCTRHRDPILTTESNSRIIVEALRNSVNFHGWVAGKYVVMPDHVHFFARQTPDAKSLRLHARLEKVDFGENHRQSFATLAAGVLRPRSAIGQ